MESWRSSPRTIALTHGETTGHLRDLAQPTSTSFAHVVVEIWPRRSNRRRGTWSCFGVAKSWRSSSGITNTQFEIHLPAHQPTQTSKHYFTRLDRVVGSRSIKRAIRQVTTLSPTAKRTSEIARAISNAAGCNLRPTATITLRGEW